MLRCTRGNTTQSSEFITSRKCYLFMFERPWQKVNDFYSSLLNGRLCLSDLLGNEVCSQKTRGDKKEERQGLVAVGIDKDKGSQYALKWAVDHLLNRAQTVILVHVNPKSSSVPTPNGTQVSMNNVNDSVTASYRQQLDHQTKELFFFVPLFLHTKRSRSQIQCKDVVLEEADLAKD